MLCSLEDTSAASYLWFHTFVADHPPLQEGEAFLAGLLKAQVKYSAEMHACTQLGADMTAADRIAPGDIANRILAQRAAMAQAIATPDGPLARFVAVSNVNVLRAHVQKSTYVSGDWRVGGEHPRGHA